MLSCNSILLPYAIFTVFMQYKNIQKTDLYDIDNSESL